SPDMTLYDYLNRISLLSRDEPEEQDMQGKVSLMTIHAAKGLEFDVVCVAGVEDGIIPHARALTENEANLEEERRLFYVALTRAKERLYLTSCKSRRLQGRQRECVPSPFLEELPAHTIEVAEDTEVDDSAAVDHFSRMRAVFTEAAELPAEQ
ncbi:MAG: ATP-dependent helicase, partial [Spirochaetales bacterium]